MKLKNRKDIGIFELHSLLCTLEDTLKSNFFNVTYGIEGGLGDDDGDVCLIIYTDQYQYSAELLNEIKDKLNAKKVTLCPEKPNFFVIDITNWFDMDKAWGIWDKVKEEYEEKDKK